MSIELGLTLVLTGQQCLSIYQRQQKRLNSKETRQWGLLPPVQLELYELVSAQLFFILYLYMTQYQTSLSFKILLSHPAIVPKRKYCLACRPPASIAIWVALSR